MKTTLKMLQRLTLSIDSIGSCRSPVRTAGGRETELKAVSIEIDTDAQQYTERQGSKVSPRVFANFGKAQWWPSDICGESAFALFSLLTYGTSPTDSLSASCGTEACRMSPKSVHLAPQEVQGWRCPFHIVTRASGPGHHRIEGLFQRHPEKGKWMDGRCRLKRISMYDVIIGQIDVSVLNRFLRYMMMYLLYIGHPICINLTSTCSFLRIYRVQYRRE